MFHQNEKMALRSQLSVDFFRNLALLLIYSTKGKSCYWCLYSEAHASLSSYDNFKKLTSNCSQLVVLMLLRIYSSIERHVRDAK